MTVECVKMTVDGEKVSARADETVLTVCRRLGKDIPTLCHHEAIEPYASCRVCMVEITVRGWSSLVPSCHYLVSDGLIVATDTPTVRDARKVVLELLLARCPGSDRVRELAARFGVTETPYETDDPDEACILCGLCVRVCQEVIGASAIGFAGRGVDRHVSSPFELPSDVCIGCQACVNVCPTGYVVKRLQQGKLIMETWHTELEQHTCTDCGGPFLTVKQIEFIKERAGKELSEEEMKLCPACRRRLTGQNIKAATKAAGAIFSES